MSMKIKRDDLVKVIAGKDKGKEGKVIAVNHKKGTVLVEGVNMVTKHTKPSAAEPAGRHRYIRKLRLMHPTLCMSTKEKQHVSVSLMKDGKKVRVAKSNW